MNFPFYLSIGFGCTVIMAILIFFRAANYSKPILTLLVGWVLLQSVLSIYGFYTVVNTFPPRFALLIFPPLLFISIIFITKKGKRFLDELNLKSLTIFHTLRIPVEFVLYGLFLHKAVPQLMTFEGRNFDILSGLSAPMIYYFVFVKKIMGPRILLVWNCICLFLLFNIVFYAILSLPSSFQQFGFAQPNIAILYFPFVLLPSALVPLVLFSHLAAIRKLIYQKLL